MNTTCPNTRRSIVHWAVLHILTLLLVAADAAAQSHDLAWYLATGVSNSPLLREYENTLAAASLDSLRLKAFYRPQVSAGSSNAYAPVMGGVGYDAAVTNIANVSELVTVNQTFVGRQNLDAQFRQIGLSADSVRAIQGISIQDLRRSITAQYITTYGDLRQLLFYEDINSIFHNQDTLLEKLTRDNIYKQSEYLTFLVTMKQQDLQLRQVRIQYRSDHSMLNYLCGIVDTAEVALDSPVIALAQLADMTTSPFFTRFQVNRLILDNQLKLIDYSYRPKVSAYVNGGYLSSLQYMPERNFGASVGLNIALPIYDGHQRGLLKKKVELFKNTNEQYGSYFARQYRQQVAMLRQQLEGINNLLSDINEQISYAEGLIKVNARLLETGDVKIADFVIAINNYLTARNQLTQNYINRMQIINQINYWNH